MYAFMLTLRVQIQFTFSSQCLKTLSKNSQCFSNTVTFNPTLMLKLDFAQNVIWADYFVCNMLVFQ